MTAPCLNPECPSQWCDLPCTCLKEPAADLAALDVKVYRNTAMPGENPCVSVHCVDAGLPEHHHIMDEIVLHNTPEPAADLATLAIGQIGPVLELRTEAGPELVIPEGGYVVPWLSGQMLDRLLAEVLATPDGPELTPEQSLLVDLTEILTEAQHAPGCYIDPEETHCVCLIGKVKAVLPRCQETRNSYGGPAEPARLGEPSEPYWRCVLIEHPDNPDGHNFGDA